MVSHNNLINSHYEAVAQVCCKKELFSKPYQTSLMVKLRLMPSLTQFMAWVCTASGPNDIEIIFDTK